MQHLSTGYLCPQTISFNPYYNGLFSATRKDYSGVTKCQGCFNPYYNGLFSATQSRGEGVGFVGAVCFNPYYNGLFSATLLILIVIGAYNMGFNPYYNGLFSAT